MKNFIVLAAVLPFLLIFLMQFTLDQKNNGNISRFQDCVYAAKEEAKQEGCFTDDICGKLRSNIARQFQISPGDIEINATEEVQYRVNLYEEAKVPLSQRRGMIHYRVAVPLKQLVAGNRFFGISEKENQGMYVIESYTASERLP